MLRRALLVSWVLFFAALLTSRVWGTTAAANSAELLCDVVGDLAGVVLPPAFNLNGPLPHQQLPKPLRHITRELANAREAFLTGKRSQNLSQMNHRVFAEHIVKYLASRGISASAVEMPDKKGYRVQLDGIVSAIPDESTRARHLSTAMFEARAGHESGKIGFRTESLLNNVSNRPGSAQYTSATKATTMSIEELIGDRIFPNGKHELGHFHRDVDPNASPQFSLRDPEWTTRDISGSAESPYQKGFSVEEVSTTYPISFKDNMDLASECLANAKEIGDELPEMRDAFLQEAYRRFDRAMFEARVSSELFRAANKRMQPVLDGFSKDYVVEVLSGNSKLGEKDRVLKEVSGNKPLFYFRSDQLMKWTATASGREGQPMMDAWTTNPQIIREALRGEQKTMTGQLAFMRDTIIEALKVPEFNQHWSEVYVPRR